MKVYSNQNLPSWKKIEILSQKYSNNGATIRVSFAKDIFSNGKEEDLISIINSPRVSLR